MSRAADSEPADPPTPVDELPDTVECPGCGDTAHKWNSGPAEYGRAEYAAYYLCPSCPKQAGRSYLNVEWKPLTWQEQSAESNREALEEAGVDYTTDEEDTRPTVEPDTWARVLRDASPPTYGELVDVLAEAPQGPDDTTAAGEAIDRALDEGALDEREEHPEATEFPAIVFRGGEL